MPLTPKAFDALLLLVQNAGRTVTKDELMEAVWPGSFVEESNLTQTIFMVRKALDETTDRRYIFTVQGQGYRFLVPVREGASGRQEVQEIEETVVAPPPITNDASDIQSPLRPRSLRSWRSASVALAAVVVALILIGGVAIWPWHSRQAHDEQPGSSRLATVVRAVYYFAVIVDAR